MSPARSRAFEPAWVVDPVVGRAGVATVTVVNGTIDVLTWRDGEAAAEACWRAGANPSADAPRHLILPTLIDLHAHFRQPGALASEEVATGARAAAHGGYGTVCVMPNTEPAADTAAIVRESVTVARGERTDVRLLPIGAATRGRRGVEVAPIAALAEAGAVAVSDDGNSIADATVMRAVLVAAGGAGLALIEHCEDSARSAAGEAADGRVATRLGLPAWPADAEVEAAQQAIDALRDALVVEPRARLHLTHLSTAAALRLVRLARDEGLPITCDVTPHHLAMTDAWILGDRRWAWETVDEFLAPLAADAFDGNLRVCPPLRNATDAAACRAALRDGTALAIATDHAPHSRERKEVEFGAAANGIAGIETSLSVALAAQAAGELSLATIAAAFTVGPSRLLGAAAPCVGVAPGAPADLVLVDRTRRWVPSRSTLVGRSHNTPLLGQSLPGVVEVTTIGGETVWEEARGR